MLGELCFVALGRESIDPRGLSHPRRESRDWWIRRPPAEGVSIPLERAIYALFSSRNKGSRGRGKGNRMVAETRLPRKFASCFAMLILAGIAVGADACAQSDGVNDSQPGDENASAALRVRDRGPRGSSGFKRSFSTARRRTTRPTATRRAPRPATAPTTPNGIPTAPTARVSSRGPGASPRPVRRRANSRPTAAASRRPSKPPTSSPATPAEQEQRRSYRPLQAMGPAGLRGRLHRGTRL